MSEENIDELISRNAPLFTVMGVFGAISVYFTQLDIDSQWTRLGIVSSLSIFLLVGLAILKNLSPDSSDLRPLAFIVNNPVQQRGHIVFAITFSFLILSIAGIVVQYSGTLMFLAQFACLILGMSAVIIVPDFPEPDQDATDAQNRRSQFRHYTLRGVSAAAIGLSGLLFLWIMEWIPIDQWLTFRSSSLSSAVSVGILTGLILSGLVFISITILGMLLVSLVNHFGPEIIKESVEQSWWLIDEDLE